MKLLRHLFEKIDSFSSGDGDVLLMVAVGKVYSWDGRIVRRIGGSGLTHCIAEHKNELFEGMIAGVHKFTPVGSEFLSDQVGEGETVNALCTHNGRLYHMVGGTPEDPKNEIFETLENKRVAVRESRVTTLASHSGKLYDGGWYGIRETLTGTKVSDRYCDSLCSHGGQLHAAILGDIVDALSNRRVAKYPGAFIDASICSHHYRLLCTEENHGIRDVFRDELILPFDAFVYARGKLGPIHVPNMISVTPLTYMAITEGKEAALRAIERKYRNQLAPHTVQDIFPRLPAVRVDILGIVDPGVAPSSPAQGFLMGNVQGEFIADPQLGIVHGRGNGHALIRTEALRNVAGKHQIYDYPSLVKAIFSDGYHVKNIDYIRFDS